MASLDTTPRAFEDDGVQRRSEPAGDPGPAKGSVETADRIDKTQPSLEQRHEPLKPAQQNAEPAPPRGGLRGMIERHPRAFIIVAIIVVLLIVGAVLWYLQARNYESTDDAFIDTRAVLISPQITGNITGVLVTDNQIVKAGDLLAIIDPRDYQAAVDRAVAQVKQGEAAIKNVQAQIVAQQSQIEQAEKQVAGAQAALNFSNDENKRDQDLLRTGSGTLQQAQQATSDLQSKQATLDAAKAGLMAAQRQVDVLKAQQDIALAQLDQNKADEAQANANLSRTELRASVDSRVTRLTAAVGALATPAQSIMVLVPLDVWVTANFKESQLAEMRVGQPVNISVDAFGRSFTGRVDSIQAGSGTAFSLLPAENATGNYVKVVQRVPVKITFNQRPDVELGPGMSVVPTVTVHP